MKRNHYAYSHITPPASLDPSQTVALAASNNESRPVLQHVHRENGVEAATDGFRLHIVKNSRAKSCPVCKKEKYRFPDFWQIVPLTWKHRIVIDSRTLRAATVRAGIFAREEGRVVKLRINESLEISGTSERIGEGRETVPALASEGEEIIFALNYTYLIDALDHCAPNGGPVEILTTRDNAPIKINGKDRVAVLAPMCLQ